MHDLETQVAAMREAAESMRERAAKVAWVYARNLVNGSLPLEKFPDITAAAIRALSLEKEVSKPVLHRRAYLEEQLLRVRALEAERDETERKLRVTEAAERAALAELDRVTAERDETVRNLPGIGDADIRRLIHERDAAWADVARLRGALLHCKHRPHEHNPGPDFTVTHCEVIAKPSPPPTPRGGRREPRLALQPAAERGEEEGNVSLYDYRKALELSADDPPFASLIMAAMLKGDTNNVRLLREAWPDLWAELDRRYHSRLAIETADGKVLGGALPEDAP